VIDSESERERERRKERRREKKIARERGWGDTAHAPPAGSRGDPGNHPPVEKDREGQRECVCA
jgi:hypothetical protein